MKKIHLKERLALIFLGAILVTNPASGKFIFTMLEVAFEYIFRYGSEVNFVASAGLIVYVFIKMWESRDKVNTTPKSKKKTEAYLAT